MPSKNCIVCKNEFFARLTKHRTCSIVCRNRLIATEKQEKHTKTKNCAACGASFIISGRVHDRITCSPSCAYQVRADARKERTAKYCQTCQLPYEVKQSEAEGSHYCSKACLYARNSAMTLRTCVVCGVEFKSPPSQMHVVTCSPACGYQIRENNDQRVAWHCAYCDVRKLESPSHVHRRVYCSEKCMYSSTEHIKFLSDKISGDKNPSWKGGITYKVVSLSGLKYHRSQPSIEALRTIRRNKAIAEQTPTWANKTKIRAIYAEARLLTRLTGIKYEVDHIVPLQGIIVRGFHWEGNLRIVTARANRKKGDAWWPDMPGEEAGRIVGFTY